MLCAFDGGVNDGVGVGVGDVQVARGGEAFQVHVDVEAHGPDMEVGYQLGFDGIGDEKATGGYGVIIGAGGEGEPLTVDFAFEGEALFYVGSGDGALDDAVVEADGESTWNAEEDATLAAWHFELGPVVSVEGQGDEGFGAGEAWAFDDGCVVMEADDGLVTKVFEAEGDDVGVFVVVT